MSKASLEAAKNSLLASNIKIPAIQHRQFEQLLIEELFDANSRFLLLLDLPSAINMAPADLVSIVKAGVPSVITFQDMITSLEQEPLVDGSGTTANGLSAVDLGGSLTTDANIVDAVIGTHDFNVGGFADNYLDAIGLYARSINIEGVNNSGVTLTHRNGYANLNDRVRLNVTSAGIAFGAFGVYEVGFQGAKYDADYSTAFVDRSIPDVAWVNEQLANAQPNLVDGNGTTIPVSGDRVNIGGIFTAISLDGDAFNLSADEMLLTAFTNNIVLNKSVDVLTNTQAWPALVLRTEVGNGAGDNGFGTMMEFQVESNVGGTFAKNAGIIYQLEENSATPGGAMSFMVHGAGGNRDNTFISGIAKVYGLYYPANMASYNASEPRWLTDKQYVDEAITGVTDVIAGLNYQAPLVNGIGTTIPVSADRVNLGGTFTDIVTLTSGDGKVYFEMDPDLPLGLVSIITNSGAENLKVGNNQVTMKTANNEFQLNSGSFGGSPISAIRNTLAANNATEQTLLRLRRTVSDGVGANNLAGLLEFSLETPTNGVFTTNAGIAYKLTTNHATTPIGVLQFLVNQADHDTGKLVAEAFGFGMQYPLDFSSNNTANNRWLTDKGYVDTAITTAIGGIPAPNPFYAPVIHGGTTLTLDDSYHNKLVYITNAAGCAVTVPAGLTAGLMVHFACDADGDDVSFVASGTTLNGEGTTIMNPLTGATLVHLGSNAYFLTGALTENPANITKTKTFIVPNPVNGGNYGFYTDRAITITKLSDNVQGTSSPSATWNVSYAPAANTTPGTTVLAANRVTTSLTGASTTTLANPAIPAGSYVRLRISAVSGSITQLEVNLTILES